MAAPSGQPFRAVILVIEDEPHLREVLIFQLTSAGFEVLAAADGEEGLRLAIATLPDLILTDVMMPGLDGYQLAKTLRGTPATSRIPIVFLTAKVTMKDKLRGFAEGANDYITKPWQASELMLRIGNIVEWERDRYRDRIDSRSINHSDYFSCFISYSGDDEVFTSRLHGDFMNVGIRCWKWDIDATIGEDLWRQINDAMHALDKVVLVASHSSLKSAAVNREIERAIRLEDERTDQKQRGDLDGPIEVLFPVRLDDFIFEGWEHGRKADVLRKVIADARGWEQSNEIYDRVRTRLLRDLRRTT